MAKRAGYYEHSAERGNKAERYLNFLFKKNSFNYIWYNRKKESMKKWDFAFFYSNKKIRFLIECESKGYRYESNYKKDGVDFQAVKIERKYPHKCYYFMPIGNDDIYEYIIYLTMDEIKEHGKRLTKWTARRKHDDTEEWFYRVPFDKCKISYPSIKKIEKVNPFFNT